MILDDHKVAFIVCVDNVQYYEECRWYIERLYIPSGFVTDIICITGAESIAEAYNFAMESSDARYKVYLHQDVFIYYREFLIDTLRIFELNDRLGLLGVLGGVNLPENAIAYNAWNRGGCFFCLNNSVGTDLQFYDQCTEQTGYMKAEAVDGMLLMTQYDIRWREDLALRWDFYDISHSLEFRRRGYHVGIPFQKEPWCMHDCGYTHIKEDKSRENLLREYQDFFNKEYVPLPEEQLDRWQGGERLKLQEQLAGVMKKCFDTGMFDQISGIWQSFGNREIASNELQYALNLAEIYIKEKKDVGDAGSFFFEVSGFNAMKAKYDTIKFLLRHIENNTSPEKMDRLIEMMRREELSAEALWCIGRHCAFKMGKMFERLFEYCSGQAFL